MSADTMKEIRKRINEAMEIDPEDLIAKAKKIAEEKGWILDGSHMASVMNEDRVVNGVSWSITDEDDHATFVVLDDGTVETMWGDYQYGSEDPKQYTPEEALKILASFPDFEYRLDYGD